MHPAERRRQNILCNQHIPMSVEELLERLLDSDMNTHTGHLGMVEVHLQQPIINQLRYFNVGEISHLSIKDSSVYQNSAIGFIPFV